MNNESQYASLDTSHTEQLNELAAALSAFQGEVPIIPKNKEVKFKGVQFKYADLSDIMKTIQKPLSANGLAILQSTEYHSRQAYLVTMLTHSSGQWIKSRMHMSMMGNDMKSLGSSLTYARRYALSSMLGLATDDDIDALPEIQNDHNHGAKLTSQQLAAVKKLIGEDSTLLQRAVSHYGVSALEDVPASCYGDLMNNLQQARTAA
jgi:hypothetical protein